MLNATEVVQNQENAVRGKQQKATSNPVPELLPDNFGNLSYQYQLSRENFGERNRHLQQDGYRTTQNYVKQLVANTMLRNLIKQ